MAASMGHAAKNSRLGEVQESRYFGKDARVETRWMAKIAAVAQRFWKPIRKAASTAAYRAPIT